MVQATGSSILLAEEQLRRKIRIIEKNRMIRLKVGNSLPITSLLENCF
jgi:hypothetical protein